MTSAIDPALAKALDLKAAPERPDRRRERLRDDKGRMLSKEKVAALELEQQVAAEAAAIGAAPDVSRETARAPTRGRPASSEATEEDGYVDDGLTRRNLEDAEGNTFDIPAHLMKRGWVYQWETTAVYGQPADPADRGASERQGWRPCTDPAIRAHFMAHGYDKRTIEQRGMILLTRPLRLNVQAAQEMKKKADEQKLSKMRAAMAAPNDQSPFMPRAVTALQIEGELGAYGDDPISRER